MKGTLARLGIRNFKPTLRKAAERVTTLHTPEGSALPPNVSAELQRNMARLGFVVSQIKEIEAARQKRLEQEPETEPHAMVRHLARVVGVGVETADILVNEVLSRPMRDRKAVARYAGLTGSPDESGAKRREQGLAKAGNARVRRSMIQLAWRFLRFQKQSALALWYRARTADSRFNQRTVAGILDMIWMLGAMVDASDRADQLVRSLESRLAEARKHAERLNRRPRVFFEEWDDPLISGIGWVSELVEIAGGVDIFADRRNQGSAKDRVVTHEEVIAREPYLIIGSRCGKKFRPERVATRAGFDRIPAVPHQDLYEIKSSLILQPGPAALTDGLAKLQRIIEQWATLR